MSMSREKLGDAEFISMLPITTAEELADDADAKGCMCLKGSATTEEGIFVVCVTVSRYRTRSN